MKIEVADRNGKIPLGKFIGKMQKKVWYYEKWVGRHASFPPRQFVKKNTDKVCVHMVYEVWRSQNQ